jgi:hypothetical protein
LSFLTRPLPFGILEIKYDFHSRRSAKRSASVNLNFRTQSDSTPMFTVVFSAGRIYPIKVR